MGMKAVKGLLLVGHEKVPHDFQLRNGDLGDRADGAGNCRRPARPAWITGKDRELAEPRTSIFFLRYGIPDWPGWAKWGRKDWVYLWVF